MPAGKSPNNAYNLHKERMKIVLRTIVALRGVRILDFRSSTNKLDTELSRPHFYWKVRGGGKYLFSKGYNNHRHCPFPYPVPESLLNGHTPPFLIIKVREYYTDGIRAIGAMV